MAGVVDLTGDDSDVDVKVKEPATTSITTSAATSATTTVVASEEPKPLVLMKPSPSASTRFSESRFQLHESAGAAAAAAVARTASRGSGSGSGVEPSLLPPSNSGPKPSTGERVASSPMGQSNSTLSTSASKAIISPARNNDNAARSNVAPQGSPSLAARMAPQPTQTPPRTLITAGSHQTPKPNTPATSQTPRKKDWSDGKIESSLFNLTKELDRNHAKLVCHNLRTASRLKAPERRHLSPAANLADVKLPVLPGDSKQKDTMKVQLKLHKEKDPARVNAGKKKLTYEVTCIKSDKERVPKYRFHHVQISRNILSPNTNLKFIPHLRDMEANEEERYRRWINELEAMDLQSGFNATSSNRAQKASKMLKEETAIDLSLYINRWINKLGLENCSKASLVRYMATQPENNDKMTPQQKHSIMNKLSDDVASPRAVKAAKMFTDAFNNLWSHTDLTLKDVLVHDETVEAVVENKKLVKDGKSDTEKQGPEQLLEAVEGNLLSYTILGCLFCYSHSCEHGDHDRDNHRRPIGVELIGKFGGLMRQKLAKYVVDPSKTDPSLSSVVCRNGNGCYIHYETGNVHAEIEPWTEDEVLLLQGLYIALGATDLHLPCLASALLGRLCWEVYRKILQLELGERPLQQLANVGPNLPQAKGLPWYDRFRKELKGDWQEHLNAHEFTRREIRDPCNHDGPCGKGCPCVDAKLLCDRFCRCTADDCAHKYTGCACHANGKTCLQQKNAGRPCICLQLNRECDPVLCSGCGALERADPQNAYDTDLHATGCQNVALQRGVSKSVLLGESQIPYCGYGLFTAEDIAQDEFVIEYLGELISHDEGVRREARRGDVFDEHSHSSYLFTLLDYEGIWVDAAIYGNLSRYINHAQETDKVGKKRVNIIPQILFVNGDFRIKFKAMRDIKAGEELFFNYGENFPNLTKKLLDSKDGESRPKRGGSRGGGRGGRGRGGRGRGRGGVKFSASAETKKAPPLPVAALDDEDDDLIMEPALLDEDDDEDDDDFAPGRNLKPKRGVPVFGGRGGRKRKRPIVEEHEDSAEADSLSPPPPTRGSRGGRAKSRGRGSPRRGGRGSRGGGRGGSRGGIRGGSRGGSRGGGRGGSRGGAQSPNGGSVTTTAAFALNDGSYSHDAAPPVAPTREPAHAILGTPSSRGGRKRRRHVDDDDDDDDDDDPDFRTAIPRSGSSYHSPSLRRRTARHIPDSDEEMLDALDEELHTPTRNRASTDGGSMDGSMDGSSPVSRSQRRRQRPARYREGD